MIITCLSLLLLILLIYIIYIRRKMHQEITCFTEAVINRDFSRKLPERGKNKPLDKLFNTVTGMFRTLSREKEAQQNYLREMLELVDAGILAYQVETYETLWMNEAFNTMLNIPSVKNINWLKKHNEKLFNELQQIPLDKSILMTIHARKQTLKTLTKASIFRTGGQVYKLIAFHNVSAAMEEVETNAWKGLLNVMTHEIMNSIVPVSSLSDTLKKKVHTLKTASSEAGKEDLEDMEFALETIYRRSEGLLQFAENYRSLSRKVVPDRKVCNLYELISSVYSLMNPSMQQKGIAFHKRSGNRQVIACIDRILIEQVIINFITNAASAVREKKSPRIYLFSGSDPEGHPYITVADNGHGIPDHIRDKLFIPFFSTKKNGNRIGLSIAQEIVKQHNGKIHIQSQENRGSAFTILLNPE